MMLAVMRAEVVVETVISGVLPTLLDFIRWKNIFLKTARGVVSGAGVLCFTSETGLYNLDNTFIMHFLVF